MNTDQKNVCCPVCTLYLREGISMRNHLNTHPKDQVIDALVRCSVLLNYPQIKLQENANSELQHLTGHTDCKLNRHSGSSLKNPTSGGSQLTISYQHYQSNNTQTLNTAPKFVSLPTVVASSEYDRRIDRNQTTVMPLIYTPYMVPQDKHLVYQIPQHGQSSNLPQPHLYKLPTVPLNCVLQYSSQPVPCHQTNQDIKESRGINVSHTLSLPDMSDKTECKAKKVTDFQQTCDNEGKVNSPKSEEITNTIDECKSMSDEISDMPIEYLILADDIEPAECIIPPSVSDEEEEDMHISTVETLEYDTNDYGVPFNMSFSALEKNNGADEQEEKCKSYTRDKSFITETELNETSEISKNDSHVNVTSKDDQRDTDFKESQTKTKILTASTDDYIIEIEVDSNDSIPSEKADLNKREESSGSLYESVFSVNITDVQETSGTVNTNDQSLIASIEMLSSDECTKVEPSEKMVTNFQNLSSRVEMVPSEECVKSEPRKRGDTNFPNLSSGIKVVCSEDCAETKSSETTDTFLPNSIASIGIVSSENCIQEKPSETLNINFQNSSSSKCTEYCAKVEPSETEDTNFKSLNSSIGIAADKGYVEQNLTKTEEINFQDLSRIIEAETSDDLTEAKPNKFIDSNFPDVCRKAKPSKEVDRKFQNFGTITKIGNSKNSSTAESSKTANVLSQNLIASLEVGTSGDCVATKCSEIVDTNIQNTSASIEVVSSKDYTEAKPVGAINTNFQNLSCDSETGTYQNSTEAECHKTVDANFQNLNSTNKIGMSNEDVHKTVDTKFQKLNATIEIVSSENCAETSEVVDPNLENLSATVEIVSSEDFSELEPSKPVYTTLQNINSKEVVSSEHCTKVKPIGFKQVHKPETKLSKLNAHEMFTQKLNLTTPSVGLFKEIMFDPSYKKQKQDSELQHEIVLNIRADETMPPRGELSEQESLGGNDSFMWIRNYCGADEDVSTSYDLMARETWDVSDGSDTETNKQSKEISTPRKSRPQAVTKKGKMKKMYKCTTCTETFNCPKERRVHQKKIHKEQTECSKIKNSEKITSTDCLKEDATVTVKKRRTYMGAFKSPERIIFDDSKKIDANNYLMGFDANNCSVVFDSNNYSVAFDANNCSMPVNANNSSVAKMKTIEILAAANTIPKKPRTGNRKSRKTISLGEKKSNKKETVIKSYNCPVVECLATFSSKWSLQRHMSTVHKEKKKRGQHVCATCQENFETDKLYLEHLKIHPLECNHCGKHFGRHQNLNLHMKRHLGIRPYKCEVCDKTFVTKQKLTEHTNVHTGDAPIQCDLCYSTFRRHSNLVQHKNRHHRNVKKKVKDFVCHCGEVFHTKKKFEWHKEIHDTKPKACFFCSMKFVHSISLTRHIRKSHNSRYVPQKEREIENVECPVCNKVCLKNSLAAHLRIHTGERPHQCNHCSKRFTTKWNLHIHRWIHTGRSAKPFKCEQCKKAFYRESAYVAHLRSHRGSKPYSCNYCGRCFVYRYNCNRHIREHEVGKRYVCTVCKKRFHRSYYLKEHMTVHTASRSYVCHICGKGSPTKSNHNKHLKIHHAREPVNAEG